MEEKYAWVNEKAMDINIVLVLEALTLTLLAVLLLVAPRRWVQIMVATILLIGAGVCAAMLASKAQAQTVLDFVGACSVCGQ